MITVFVSSTFTDLKEHRLAARETLRQAGFIDVAMEDLGARDERPMGECIRLVQESDYFVGIYAYRYGYVPEENEASITEVEYQAAAEAGLKRLIYIVDPDFPWLPSAIEQGEGAAKLTDLKERLQKTHIVKRFKSPDDLAKNVVADLGREVRRAELKQVDSVEITASEKKPWTDERQKRYFERRSLELVHVIEPSITPGQDFDILIYLVRHRRHNNCSPFELEDVEKAEFYLGGAWQNRVFTRENDGSNSYFGIKVSAFGTFMCLCRVSFTDGEQIILDRYIDFESAAPSKRQI